VKLERWIETMQSEALRSNASTPARHIAEVAAVIAEKLEQVEAGAGRSVLLGLLSQLRMSCS
jgi:hypothetical protein